MPPRIFRPFDSPAFIKTDEMGGKIPKKGRPRPASFMDSLKRKRKLFYTKYIPEGGGGGGGGGGGAGGGGGGGIGMV